MTGKHKRARNTQTTARLDSCTATLQGMGQGEGGLTTNLLSNQVGCLVLVRLEGLQVPDGTEHVASLEVRNTHESSQRPPHAHGAIPKTNPPPKKNKKLPKHQTTYRAHSASDQPRSRVRLHRKAKAVSSAIDDTGSSTSTSTTSCTQEGGIVGETQDGEPTTSVWVPQHGGRPPPAHTHLPSPNPIDLDKSTREIYQIRSVTLFQHGVDPVSNVVRV